MKSVATIQVRKSGGHNYWYIVESRRINGKPRPIVLAYLGKADDLLKRIQGLTEGFRLKSYSHGAVAAMLDIANRLDICEIINQHTHRTKKHLSDKPIRNHLTVGATLLLAAIGRSCMPTSKRGWLNWAKTTSLEYLLRVSLNKLDSQHFWDLMDAVPTAAIERIEEQLLKKVFELYRLKSDSLFYDTTNFFTYIDTTNERCTIAKRGKNKQKRTDLRQVGLAVVVTHEDKIPLFHLTYEGNMSDANVFKEVIGKLKARMEHLKLNSSEHTLVFDRGNNSKQNMVLIKESQFHYVGALTPYQHKALVEEALDYLNAQTEESSPAIYRDKRIIWGEERTVVIYVSEKLRAGQIRGIYQTLRKNEQALKDLQAALLSPKAKKYNKIDLEKKILGFLKGQHINQLISWSLEKISDDDDHHQLHYFIDRDKLQEIEDQTGLRIVMTDHHDWESEKIIKTYQGQSEIEHAFKNLKNPYHLTLKPQFHWTNQKIIVHYFICMVGYLLAALTWREAKAKVAFSGSLDTLLDTLNSIRLATLLEETKHKGRLKASYKLEDMTEDEQRLMESLNIMDFHECRPQFEGLGVYS
jgi:transposase